MQPSSNASVSTALSSCRSKSTACLAYDPAQYAYGYAYPQYYQPGNPGFPQPLAPIDRADAEALAEASAAAAAAKGADDDAAPGEPEEGTPKLKPRADTFDGPAL